jgi:putative tricarboxylic transport membrane protein
MAMVLGALTIHGIKPGPLFMSQNPDLFWGVITSMYLGNVILLLFNLPMIALWVKILKVPYYILYPLILLFCVLGVYTINNNEFEIYILVLFGGFGYLLRKLQFDLAPMIIALVLGPMLEENFRQALVLSKGDISVFFARPISLAFLLFTFLLFLSYIFPLFRRKRPS